MVTYIVISNYSGYRDCRNFEATIPCHPGPSISSTCTARVTVKNSAKFCIIQYGKSELGIQYPVSSGVDDVEYDSAATIEGGYERIYREEGYLP